LGWKNGYDLLRYLSISDVYVQPGSASVLMQNTICAGNAIIAANKEIYGSIVNGNGWIIESVEELGEILEEIYSDPFKLERMKMASMKLGGEFLDYSVLAKKYTY
jgi:glycosyltransferase involved in cell wall biosynthesis